jgi:cytochrome c-type biogenesis protein CcmH/NrfG
MKQGLRKVRPELYQDALRAEPKNVTALIGLGITRQRENKHADAEVALQKALAYDPVNEPAAYRARRHLFQTGALEGCDDLL